MIEKEKKMEEEINNCQCCNASFKRGQYRTASFILTTERGEFVICNKCKNTIKWIDYQDKRTSELKY